MRLTMNFNQKDLFQIEIHVKWWCSLPIHTEKKAYVQVLSCKSSYITLNKNNIYYKRNI